MSEEKFDSQPSDFHSQLQSQSPHTAALDRHARKCAICHHPARPQIDDDYLHWHSPTKIARNYNLGHRCAVYRHAHATGLVALRRRRIFTVLDSIVEGAEEVHPTANDVVRAVRLYAQLTGQWTEPKRTYVITQQNSSGESVTTTRFGRRPGISSLTPPLHLGSTVPNRDTPELENGPNRSK